MEYRKKGLTANEKGRKGELREMNDTIKAAYAQKQVVIDEIKDKFEKAQSAVVVDYIGITVAQADKMRKNLREADVDYTIYKNTFVKRAIEGTAYQKLEEVLTGPSAFAISYDDVTSPARLINDAIKEFKKMSFKGGIIEGTYYDEEGLKKIALIPSKDELIAKFMGSIQSPVGKAVRTFAAIAEAKTEGADDSSDTEKKEEKAARPAEETKEAEPVKEETEPAKEAAEPVKEEAEPAKEEA